MKFLTIRDLRTHTASLRRELQTSEEVVITANGKPFAIMTRVEPDAIEEEVLAIRRAKASTALARIRARAKANGLDQLSLDEIDEIIARTRQEKRGSQ